MIVEILKMAVTWLSDVDPLLLFFGILLVVALSLVRFLYIASKVGQMRLRTKRVSPCKTMIVVGAGGHAAEMMTLLSGLSLDRYTPRIYVVAKNDSMACKKIETFEKNSQSDVRKIMRAREVGQNYVSSVFTTLTAIFNCLPLMVVSRPDLLLCNGPGTCIPVCFMAYLIKFLGIKSIEIVYVESICRVDHLSLSGLLLYYLCMADHVLVQWPKLADKYKRTEYIGKII